MPAGCRRAASIDPTTVLVSEESLFEFQATKDKDIKLRGENIECILRYLVANGGDGIVTCPVSLRQTGEGGGISPEYMEKHPSVLALS